MKAQTVGIVGMGRTGVSIAMAIKAAGADLSVIGHDRIRERAQEAKDFSDAIDRVEWNLVNTAAAADILVLAMPIAELENTLLVIGEDVQPHALILDLSGLKSQGLRWAQQYLRQGHYVGAVPVLAAAYLNDGRDEPPAATAELFRNSVFCLMPSATADPQAVETAVNFGRLLGATPYFVDPMEYDALVQGIETLPGLLAAGLFSAVHKSPAWRDILRFANTSFALATQPLQQGGDITLMALHDKRATLYWLDALIEELGAMRRIIHDGDADMVDLTVNNLLGLRERWLRLRAENEWTETVDTPVEHASLQEQFLGGWLGGKMKRDKKES